MTSRDTSIKEILKEHIPQILGICMLALATYITYRLAPIAQDIAVIHAQLMAEDQDITSLKTNKVSHNEFNQYTDQLDKRLNTIILLLGGKP